MGAGDQQQLPGMPARLYPCTPTRLLTWLDCPRRYRFAYLERPAPAKGPPRALAAIGAAVHVALAAWWARPLPARTAAGGALALRDGWRPEEFRSHGFRDAAQSAAARERAAGWVEQYLAGVDPAAEPVGVERTVSTPTSTLVLSGRIDRLDDRPAAGGLVVVDYKTGRRAPDAEEARSSLALAVYAVAAARTLRRPCVRVELHHLPSGVVAAAEHGAEGLRRKVAEAESIGRDCARADAAHAGGQTGDELFPARTSALCSWCDWRGHCPQGRAAAPDIEPWAGVDERG